MNYCNTMFSIFKSRVFILFLFFMKTENFNYLAGVNVLILKPLYNKIKFNSWEGKIYFYSIFKLKNYYLFENLNCLPCYTIITFKWIFILIIFLYIDLVTCFFLIKKLHVWNLYFELWGIFCDILILCAILILKVFLTN